MYIKKIKNEMSFDLTSYLIMISANGEKNIYETSDLILIKNVF